MSPNQNNRGLNDTEAAVVGMVESAETSRIAPRQLLEQIKKNYRLSFAQGRELINGLTRKGELAYSQELGQTFIQINFARPVRISPHLILCPPGMTASFRTPDQTVIYLEPGVSFGSGSHPTTRMCIQAIDAAVYDLDLISADSPSLAADIGTGTGVLAIALCTLTSLSCRAYDIDPVSLFQAQKNIALNRLSHRMSLSSEAVEQSGHLFSTVVANLRYPTLARMARQIRKKIRPPGILILSGIREWEEADLIRIYVNEGFRLICQASLKKWSCITLACHGDGI